MKVEKSKGERCKKERRKYIYNNLIICTWYIMYIVRDK